MSQTFKKSEKHNCFNDRFGLGHFLVLGNLYKIVFHFCDSRKRAILYKNSFGMITLFEFYRVFNSSKN
ncbi:hypothetical protein LEP1GSC150_1115 [Leptospira interrogans serovar Copenhageni str. LT2050]|uniref:Uncharacterized protein n=1 Tax=Leptospira interrogans serovar Copenhageni str. LT2050 TaxID=1001598 RepID=M3G3W8_LEPIT|nr:hypothetical protein LEP1GSC150_1115 [Leptospira interrogans serovar Copenhageni str. LT2050]